MTFTGIFGVLVGEFNAPYFDQNLTVVGHVLIASFICSFNFYCGCSTNIFEETPKT